MSESYYIYSPAMGLYLASCLICIEENVYDVDWVTNPNEALPFDGSYSSDALIAYLYATKIVQLELRSVPCFSV